MIFVAPAHAAAIGDVDALVEFYDLMLRYSTDTLLGVTSRSGKDVRTTGLMTHVTTPRFERVI